MFPANNTLLHFFDLINSKILPNFPIFIEKLFLSYLNLLFFDKSIIK